MFEDKSQALIKKELEARERLERANAKYEEAKCDELAKSQERIESLKAEEKDL